MKALPRLLIAMTIALILDGLTKIWVIQTLEPYESVPIIKEFFRLTLGYNTGVAFSMFTNSGLWPLIITGAIILGLVGWIINGFRSGELPIQSAGPLGLILGGAIANFFDRLLEGSVVDFLDFGLGTLRWPAFNLADSFIVVGVAWLLLLKMTPEDSNIPEPNQFQKVESRQ